MKASLWAMIVEGWLPRAAAVRPGGVALQTPDGAVSYAELLAGASAGAAELAARGAVPGSASRSRWRRDSPLRRRSMPACCSARSPCRSISG